ncbi:hypothetical protein NXS19_004479 [Fusarium pseudograminearum]|uniref:Uncharacterized protein n=1 Tax=Fusarium austroamericanum TaxID=282268 RepID=A0AAN5YZP5_FUSAU|nr:hypothetical protein FAUST_11037 [Fusarium austroamericanum]UZP36663.1 hypothetical protein NXS19_004479 [Fusarium pseudograminearum]
MSPKGPYRLMTVNTAPERAKRVIGAMVENLKESYTIDYVVNSERIEDVRALVEEYRPDVLFTASMWTEEQSREVEETARKIVPEIKFHAIPYGLQVAKGPDAIVEYLTEKVPALLEA